MADEVEKANVIRYFRDGPMWLAVIGPDAARGLMASADHPFEAVTALVRKMYNLGWLPDETWRPT
jgi:hypothetical protein